MSFLCTCNSSQSHATINTSKIVKNDFQFILTFNSFVVASESEESGTLTELSRDVNYLEANIFKTFVFFSCVKLEIQIYLWRETDIKNRMFTLITHLPN